MCSPTDHRVPMLRRRTRTVIQQAAEHRRSSHRSRQRREDGTVELLATRRSDGAALAIEHTVIQPYSREKEDFPRFNRAFLRGGRGPSLEISGAVLYVDVPGRTLQPGDDWDAVADAVRDGIRRSKQTLPKGRSALACSIVGGKTGPLPKQRLSSWLARPRGIKLERH